VRTVVLWAWLEYLEV